ncbi:hypothetical protein [Variovorax sp. YR566]|uniref:hypothetical protein n=1 Tax=Variovorax sp. YR566 TaxID=3450237 RepID=UPI003F7D38A8
MTDFNLTIGAPSSTRLSNLPATKYTSAPRSAPIKAVVNGVECPAWTTEGKGKSQAISCYIYFKQDDALYYVKVAGPGELAAARQSLVITTDAYEEVMTKVPPRPVTKRRRIAKSEA